MDRATPGGLSGLRRLLVQPCKPYILVAAAFSALINILYLTPTLYMLQVYDRVMQTGSLATLVLVSLVAALSLLVLSGLDGLRARILIRAGARVDAALAKPILTALLRRRDVDRVDRARAMRDLDSLRQTLTNPGAMALFDAPWTPIYILAAFLLSPWLGLLCLCAGLMMVGLTWLNERAAHQPVKVANDAAALSYARQDYAAANASEIQALGMGEALVAKQIGERAGLLDLQLKAAFTTSGYATTARFVRLVLQSAALGVGAFLAIRQMISPGAVIAASFLLVRSLQPVEQILAGWRGLAMAHSAATRLSRLLGGLGGSLTATLLPPPTGRLSFEGVTVLAPGGERAALTDVTVQIEPGQLIGVVGASGAGKSTFLKAAVGSMIASRGVVRLDGANVADWDSERLARHIGYLPQQFVLFSGTVKENIARFRGALPGADMAAIDEAAVAAAMACGAHEMILRLPHGYETMVGIGGEGVSAGQVQRIAIARALFGKPPILVLDEPNAHLDADSETALGACLMQLRAEGVTILLSAHRGALLNNADRLLQLNNGRPVAFATLAEIAALMRSRSGPEPGIGAESPVAARKRA